MWDNETIRAHLRFFKEATTTEINEREALYLEALATLSRTSDVAKDIRFLLRKLREERAARLEVAMWKGKRPSTG